MDTSTFDEVRCFKNRPVKNGIQQMHGVLGMGDAMNLFFHGVVEMHNFLELGIVVLRLYRDGREEECDPTIPVTLVRNILQPHIILFPVIFQVRTQVEHRLREFLLLIQRIAESGGAQFARFHP